MRKTLVGILLSGVCATAAWGLDVAKAVVVASPQFTGPEKKAVAMLVDEVDKRAQIRWPVAAAPPRTGVPVISIVRQSGPAEGYRIRVAEDSVLVAGNDARGVLFGVGRLLRSIRMNRGSVTVAGDLSITSAPRYRLRGHQLGYRPKTNSYDGWTVALWEQYIRDLAVFGANSIELIPPRSDDAADSPLFPLPPMRMMTEMSHLADEYGLDVWIWYPAMDKDYSDPKTVEHALQEWGDVFRQLPRIDAVFVPGGDPGHTQPKYLMALLARETEVLHRYHPKAQMWVSPQGFSKEWLDEFYGILNRDEPAWLSGIVFGPQIRVSLAELRAAVPKRYPIRHYPDITHSRQCQYPVPDWDVAYAVTEGREVINPRPRDEAHIFHATAPYTIGFLAYSEGCNDDVNKMLWSALAWDPDASVESILREYGRYFIGDRYADSFAEGLVDLEKDWQGPLAANHGVERTLHEFQEMERNATPQNLLNWRFQQALYRAYYDACTRRRLVFENGLEARAMDLLREATATGSAEAMSQAEAALNRAAAERPGADLRARVFELAEALFQSVRMQLSVPRYKAISVDRGANLDTIDTPLTGAQWLKDQFAQIRKLPGESERLKSIAQIVNWTDPGPGGFYDDLGDPARRPHLVAGPAQTGFGARTGRTSWWRFAESFYEAPLKMHYDGLDPAARYRIRIVYGPGDRKTRVRLTADAGIEIHPFREKEYPPRPVEFDIPIEATRSGKLDLAWNAESGAGGNGRGCQVSEVWLLRD